MKLKHQALSAVSATALLIAASVGVLALGGARSSFADPLDPAAVSALQAAVNNPNGALASLISQMNTESPGSGDAFAQAFQNTDTDALASALASVAGGDAALQGTIESALSTLASDPGVSAATSGGQSLSIVLNSVNSTLTTQFASNQNNNNGNGGDNNNGGNGNDLSNVNPTAGNNGQQNPPPTNQFGNPFTTGNPNSNAGLGQGSQDGSNTQTTSTTGSNPNGSGQPNSRGKTTG